jgi:aminoglycoside phosphotransferase (APT) family kinase protein
MLLIDERNAESYLRSTGRVAPDEPVHVRELTGGVSNMVLLVERPQRQGQDFVLKQARAQLRTERPWFSSVQRVWREAEVMALCTRLLEKSLRQQTTPAGITSLAACTPAVLFEDRENYLFAMTAAPRPNAVWKQALLAADADGSIARACGGLLAALHGESWQDATIAADLGDATLFDQLRVDPYYRTLVEVQPTMRGPLERLIGSLAEHRLSLVHADFSPKNLLVFSGGLMMVDFETGHYGDPAFDLGFFLSHLVLKAALHAPRHKPLLQLTESFRQAYDAALGPRIGQPPLTELWARGVQNFAGCAWARLDGKSPVEYLTQARRREQVRAICREVLQQQPDNWSQVVALCATTFQAS